jgi:hypothetical protein
VRQFPAHCVSSRTSVNTLARTVVRDARLGAGRRRAADATPRCAGCAAVLALGSRRRTRFTRCARCARTAAASQSTKRAGTRADPRAAFLAVAYAARHRPAPSLAGALILGGRVFGKPWGIEPRDLPRAAGALTGREPGSMPGLCPSPTKNSRPSPSRGRVCGGAPAHTRPRLGARQHVNPADIQRPQRADTRRPFDALRSGGEQLT